MSRILAISSGGGHWEQLMVISTGFAGHDVTYANTIEGLGEKSGLSGVAVVHDCNRNKLMANVRCALDAFALLWRLRPDVVISTGAAPGLIALALGHLMGAHTVWIDSVANSEQLSMSGRLAKKFASTHVTQWEHLATGRSQYWGNAL
jgi:UDP-N-acetylglucosamine:LPS N-acetylglucosamine transferase